MSRTAEQLLEFDRLLELLRGKATCALGRRAMDALAPRTDAAALEAEFALIGEAVAWLRSGFEMGFGAVADPEKWLERLAIPAMPLSVAELLDAASLLEAAGELKKTLRAEATKYPRLAAVAAALGDFRATSQAIRRAILPNGEISDAASPELKRLRAAAAHTREKVQQTLERILRAREEDTGDDYVTVRNDRYVIPVRAAERRAVPGVVHGASATGQTLFVEPLEAIELNNRMVQLAEDEAAEIARILLELTERLRMERGPVEFAARTIAQLDSVFARARFAQEFDCTIPAFTNERSLRLEAARNPVLEAALRPQGRSVVPITLSLGGEQTVMVISGPNTGGKTVALKTTGLAALSAQSGIPVAAAHAELPLFDAVLADIGDEQSITADLSTFSAHVLNLKRMLERATPRTLALVDEMGTGTAPEEGAALAVALLEEFRARGCLTLATTHHDRLKSYATTTPGVLNAAVEFDEANLRPTYRLLVGVPGVSSGIEIARRLGLAERIIERARKEISPEAREAHELIAWLHRSRDELDAMNGRAREELRQLEAERHALQTEWVERQRARIRELETRFAAATKQLEVEISRLTADVADRKLRAQLEKHASRRVAKIASNAKDEADAAVVETLAASQADLGVSPDSRAQPVAPELLEPGMRIEVRGLKRPAIFRRRDGRTAEVEAGSLRMKVALADIVAIAAVENSGKRSTATSRGEGAALAHSRGVTVHAQPGEEASSEEINVIGCTVEEATRRVDKFLDVAALASLPRVRIIHGHGTGALRRGLAEFLGSHPLVESIHSEVEDRGGAAITVVELKS